LIKRKIRKKMLTLSIALLVRASLDSFFSLLALGINALLANAILDAAKAGARIIALLACLLTISTGVFDLTTLGTNLRLRGADHTRSERVHVHGKSTVGSRMHSQLWLNRVGDGLGGLIDSVIVRVSTDRSHVWGGRGEVSQWTTEGVAEGKRRWMGSGLEKFGPGGKARGNNWRLKERRKESGQGRSKGTREKGGKEKEKWKGETFGTTGRKKKRRDGIKEGRKGREETYRGKDFGSLRFAGIDWEKRAERRRGRKNAGLQLDWGPLYLLAPLESQPLGSRPSISSPLQFTSAHHRPIKYYFY
jgi:hypothetical protein